MMFHSLIQNKQFLVHMFAKQHFTCSSFAAAGMYTEVLIKSVIKYLCSALLAEDKIGPKMCVRHFCLCKSHRNCSKYEKYLTLQVYDNIFHINLFPSENWISFVILFDQCFHVQDLRWSQL